MDPMGINPANNGKFTTSNWYFLLTSGGKLVVEIYHDLPVYRHPRSGGWELEF